MTRSTLRSRSTSRHRTAGISPSRIPGPTARDSEALFEHTAHLGDLMEAIPATGSVSGEFLGEPGAELRAKTADSEVRLFTPYEPMQTPIANRFTTSRPGYERPGPPAVWPVVLTDTRPSALMHQDRTV